MNVTIIGITVLAFYNYKNILLSDFVYKLFRVKYKNASVGMNKLRVTEYQIM